ncbi:phage major capsid protein [Methylobacterium gnaphalii]|uniref:Phage capsid-like C-terminal domain-containing protein n=1 Tax=Methylobacterium gnaphalii TaxID=1010610 RepID=A0A512JQP8_9HYPH|nr:phage major capsid protein [Methylobacterium gnaphalii]GEP12262.1 hypothetical protein MGN01_41070 [Methylobacterium gnaphalii]GJD68734.1 hypothetical protein MMMDOFMJ_1658 [Methylobacterium gnaphalii]GLS49369.1 hypothetical protein GCM10007885_22170 [Methylobacterium gnaphalii]
MFKTRYAVPLGLAAVLIVCAVSAAALSHGGFADQATLHHLSPFLALPVAAGAETLRTLQERAAKMVQEMSAILQKAEAEDRDLNDDETAAYDALRVDHDKLAARIERMRDQAGREASLDRVEPGAGRNQRIDRAPGSASTQFETLGEFMHAVRFRPNDQRLDWNEEVGANLTTEQRAELRMDDGPSGGFAIPPQFRDQLLKLSPQQAIVRPRAQVIPAGNPPDAAITMPALDQTGAAPGNFFGGVQVSWIGEGGTKPQTDLKLREVTLTPHEVAGVMVVTDKLLRNWQASSPMIEQQLRGAIAQAEDFAFLRGDGIAKPLGYLKAGATYKVPRATANTVTYEDIVNMVVRMYGQGVFLYSRSMLGQLLKLKDEQGRPLWLPSVREGEPNTLMGRPAIENDRAPQLGSLGDLSAADFSQYLIKDGSGPFVAASEHVLFQQNKTMVKVFWNVDGAPWLTAPFQVENGDVVSPFVALDVPAA